jgi:iron uptake system component EfeO
VTNKGGDAVTEFEVMDGGRIVGEVENISPGLNGHFTVNLAAGGYTTKCPGGSKNQGGTLTVSGNAAANTSSDADLDAAVATYRAYIEDNTARLVTATTALDSAINAGDVNDAKAKYVAARPFYERVEPVAEQFGDLDAAIDARADDVPIEQVTGFHRIEKGLWVDNSTAGLAPVSAQLLKDVRRLHDEAPGLPLDALQIANGANELMGEVSASKVTGEEERYSHTDLVDFEANVEGADAAFDAVRGALEKRDKALADTLDERFDALKDALAKYKKGGTFVSYTELTDGDTKPLSQSIDSLAEPLSRMAATLATPPAS